MIDKLGLSMLNFDKSGKSDFAEGSEKYYQNLLIKDYITLLIDPRSQHILHRPIDNDTKLLKDVLKEIELASGTQEMPYGFYSLSTQTERKDDYITGKIGIGPFALNNNNHILTMLYGVKFKDFPGSIMSSLGLTDLSGNRDQDGLSIMSWLSALINAHVDIAKDPYISRLNVGPFTYNLVNTLIRTGFGKKTFYLTTQPIMKELATAYNRASSLYMLDSNKSTWKLQQEAVEEAAKNRFENVKIGDWTFDLLVQGMSDLKDTKYRSKINKYIKALFESDAFKNNANKEYDACEGVSIHVGKDDDFSDKAFLHLDADQVQLLVYLSYLQMDPYAQSVSNLVKFSKIDTKKHGKSYIEQLVFWRGFNDLFYNPSGTGLFEETGLRRMAEESYIRLKTDNAISMTKAILKDQFLQSSNAFDNAILVVLNMIQRPDSKSVDLWTDIANILSASVKSEFIVNQYAKTLPLYNSTYIRDLISESEDDLEFTQEVNSNRLKVVGNPKYDLSTYIGGAVTMKFVQDGENRLYTFNIIGYDSDTNELIVDYKFKKEHTGSIHIAGGKNTIYDRFMSLYLDLKDDPIYKDVLDIAGEPVNYLLKSLTAGKTFTYNKVNELDYITKHEAPDTYPTAKFVKLFNALDQNGPETNYIIDAWDQLLHDERHPKLKRFAEDLVVYSFITSGDKGGFTKFFKQVPLSWRIESGYADYIYDKLAEFKTQEIPTEQLEDAILNNWFDYQFVPTYQLATDGKPNFITYFNNSPSTGIARANYPTIVAALRQEPSGSVTPTIDADNAPMYIKIPRRREKEARDSQRRYTIYRRLSYGMLKSLTPIVEKDNQDRIHIKEQWIHYPIYVKVEPKGNLLTLNYLITEYMREDSTNKEYAPNQETLRGLYKLGDFISQSTVEQYKPKYGEMLTQMIQDMNYQDVFEERFGSNEADFDKAVRRTSRSDNSEDYEMQSGGANGADTVWGEIAKEFGVTKQNHWYYQEKTPNGNVEISQLDYEEGRYKVAEAARMNWGYQYKTMKDSRLIRNWALVKYADSVFAIGHLVNTGEKLFPNQQDDTRTALVPAVQGGTGYAVGMAILNKVPVYVFDQERNQWFANINGEWKRVDTPILTLRFAGIGTRLINDAGKRAIRDVFEKTFGKTKTNLNHVIGENISSKGSAFAKLLTNPFNNITVEFRGVKFDNAEHAYQTWKSGKFDQRGYDAHGGKIKGTTDFSSNFLLMVDIITAKLLQHPDLIQGINDRGGELYITNSTHNVVGDPYWETNGGQNKFIEALLQAYRNATETGLLYQENSNLGRLNKEYSINYNTELKLLQTEEFNPFGYFKNRNYSVLSEKSSRSFEKYRDKVRKYNKDDKKYGYPQQFFDEVTKILYIKSNNRKNSRLYDVVDSNTGEFIKTGVMLFTNDEFEQTKYKVSEKERVTPKTFSPARAINFALLRQMPSKNRYRMLAKLFVYDSIQVGENTVNFKIIDDFIDSMPDALWDYISSDIYGFNEDNYIGPFYVGSTDTSGITASTSKITSSDIQINLPKLGLIKMAEQVTGIKLLGRKVRFNAYGKKMPNKNRTWGEVVVLDGNLTKPEIIYLLKNILEKEYFKPSTTEENIKHYAEDNGITVEEVKERMRRNSEFDDISSAKTNEYIRLYDWQWVHFANSIELQWNSIVSDYINNRYKDKFTKNELSYIDQYFNGVLPWIKIVFNTDSGNSVEADKVSESYLRLASVIHEPFHALHALVYGTDEELLLRIAYDNLIKTPFGKLLHDLVLNTLTKNNQDEGVIYKETCAYIFQLINTPTELIDMAGDEFLSTKLYYFIKDVITLPIETETVRTQQVYQGIEIEEKAVILTFIQKVYNTIISALSKIIPRIKQYANVINTTIITETNVDISTEIESTRETERSKQALIYKKEFIELLNEFESSLRVLLNIDNNSLSSVNINNFFKKDNDTFNQISKSSLNNTEQNRQLAESYVIGKTQGIYKFKDKLFAAWRAISEINNKLGTTFLVEINKTTLGIKVPSKSSHIQNRSTDTNSDEVFSLIFNEPSYDSAVLVLLLNGYDTNEELVLQALGKLIKNLCNKH